MLNTWKELFVDLDLDKIVDQVLETDICPTKENIFRCFTYFDVLDTKVVVCSQDPYHTKGVATGLAFHVSKSTKRMPHSLRNIFREVLRTHPETKCDIESWCEQGVLMLNRALTVETNNPNSHYNLWKYTTNKMISKISSYCKTNNKRLVFMLWGNNAKELETYIDSDYHVILKHTHPSPLSRKPFVGNDHFKICNEYLQNEKIIW